ncbi:MAG: hypothetical protein OEY86_15415 [Nitrospira sp.]|nr:hypothetical protein [Nitrospira sp.]
MTKRRKVFLWLALVVSLLATGYAGTSFIFYVWLSVAAPERWPAERAALWAYSALGLAVMFLGVLIYCIVSLIKEANRRYREEQNTT